MKTKIPAKVRQRDRLAQLRLLANHEKRLAKKIRKIMVAQGKTLADYYRIHRSVDAHALADHKTAFVSALRDSYKRVMQAFAERIRRSLKSSVFDQAIQQWLTDNALSTVNDVDDTTLSIIRTVLASGEKNGRTTDQIADDILDRTDDDMVAGRAWVVARTEMHTAANFASQEAAKDTGLTLNKVWTATGDDRTRDSHAEADGQSVPIDEPFDVDGEDVDHPGDGSAENAVNCRCTMIYEQPDREDEGESDDET